MTSDGRGDETCRRDPVAVVDALNARLPVPVPATGSREYGDFQTPAHLQRDSSTLYAADSARPHTWHVAVSPPPPTGRSNGGGGGGICLTTLSAEEESGTLHGQS